MERHYYLDLAAKGLSMPIGADLVLHEHPDAAGILCDGERMGSVVAETATRFHTPLAFPRMDLEIEQRLILELAGSPSGSPEKARLGLPELDVLQTAVQSEAGLTFRGAARTLLDVIRYINTRTELLPVGMCIGPFSLMTRLVADPITPVFMAGAGITKDEDDSIRLTEGLLGAGLELILRYIKAQVAAGAKAIFVAEPAASSAFFSPAQLDAGSDVFERYALEPNRRIRSALAGLDVDLIFHCCGELTGSMVAGFASLDPAILSLGSSRRLWEDARLVSRRTVLFGNLPSKHFFSDGLITLSEVRQRGADLHARMHDIGHPFILGSECDVLSIPGSHATILGKADALAECGAAARRR